MRATLCAMTACALVACHGDGRRACVATRDCAGFERCVAGYCGNTDGGATVPPGQLGAGCAADNDCGTSLGCLQSGLGFPGGACSRACNTTPCPSGSVCADLRDTDGGVAACLPACATDDDCRQGYACCTALIGGGGCLPNSYCPRTTQGPSADLGDSCAVGGSGCASGETCQGGAPFPGGACTSPCVVGNVATCPSNGRCVSTDTGAWCLQSCSKASDCRGGYDCVPVAGVNGNVCRASTASCSGGPIDPGPPRSCTLGDFPPLVVGNGGKPVGPATAPAGCMKPVQCSTLPAGQVQDLGVHPVGDVVQFDVAPGTASITILEQSRSATDSVTFKGQPAQDNSAVPTLVRFPDGGLVYDDKALPNDADGGVLPALLAFNPGGSAATGAFTMPNTSAALALSLANGFPAGRWSMQVNDYAAECVDPATGCSAGATNANTYDVQVVTKPGPLANTGVLDVAFYIVSPGGSGLTAAAALNNATVHRMVQTLSTLLKNAGICLGTVSFYDVQSWAQQKYSSIDADKTYPCDPINQMFALSVPGNAVNIFLVQDLHTSQANGAYVLKGQDGTIPGPSTAGGSVHSGAVVSIADLISNAGADQTAYFVAHEAGHWLGLFHTSENSGDMFDTLFDTPVCLCKTCCATGTILSAAECVSRSNSSCQGGDNLMFWTLQAGVSQGRISTEQGQVMRANPVVR